MNYKIFVKVLFEKWKYMIMYSLAITTFWFLMFGNVASAAFAAHYEKKIPDIEVNGEAVNGYMLFHALDGSMQEILAAEGVTAYGLTVRELDAFADAYYQVSYRIYGAEDAFLRKLSGDLKKGKLPKSGKPEALIGSNAAKNFNVGVGDVLNMPITLEAEAGETSREYVVSGILKSDASFFSDGIYISKETYEESEHPVADNTLYVFTKSHSAYKSILQKLEDEGNGGSSVVCHYEDKVSLHETIRTALIKTIPLSGVVLTAVFVSLMKYTGRKIGLMKALGVADRDIMKLLMKGFGVYNLAGMLLSYMSLAFVRLGLGIPLPISVILYSVYSFGIIFIVTVVILLILCKRISPRLAMYPY